MTLLMFIKWDFFSKFYNILKYFYHVFLHTGLTSVFTTVDIKQFISLFSSSHFYNKWSIVWSLVSHEQFDVSSILNQWKYDLIFPCPVTMDVKLWVMVIFIFILCQLLTRSILLWFVILLFGPIPFIISLNLSTKVTYHYTFWNFLVAFYHVRNRRCLLCECVG
jgi:hypothetical protein